MSSRGDGVKYYSAMANEIKSATENNGEFSEENPDIRFQIIGERGAAAADKAEEATVRLDNLDVAREMETAEKDARAIKMATGWERGADGKWRYEIPDGKFDHTGNLHPERFKLTDEEKKFLEDRFEDSMDAFVQGTRLYQKEITENTDMADIYELGGMAREDAERYSRLEEKEKELRDAPKHLDDYIDNKALFDAYPQLKEIKVDTSRQSELFTSDGSINMGSYAASTNTIYLNYPSNDILAHEIQHAIQRMEGFATGGNPVDMRLNYVAARHEWQARKWADQLKETAKEMPEATPLEVQKALMKEYEGEEWIGLRPSEAAMKAGFNYFVRGYADRSMDELVSKLKFDENAGSEFDAKKAYRSLGGEVEARNVQSRMEMTEAERRKSLLSDTEDVARKDQIFLYEALGTSASANSRLDDVDRKRQKLLSATPVKVASHQIVGNKAVKGERALDKAINWYADNVGQTITFSTEIGDVIFDEQSIRSSLAHKYGQAKLDALTSIPDGFKSAVYLTSMNDLDGGMIENSYFAYPIRYEGERMYVLCRSRKKSDAGSKRRIYIHEVFPENTIKEHTLHSAAGENRQVRGMLLYLDLLKEVLYGKGTNTSEENNSSTPRFRISAAQDAEYRQAYEDGDEKKAIEMVRDAFLKAFPDTLVLDSDGKPKVVLHGTPNNFTIFDKNKVGTNTDAGWLGTGFYFSDERDVANTYTHTDRVMPVFLNIRNAYELDANGSDWSRIKEKIRADKDDVIGNYRNWKVILERDFPNDSEYKQWCYNTTLKYLDEYEKLQAERPTSAFGKKIHQFKTAILLNKMRKAFP